MLNRNFASGANQNDLPVLLRPENSPSHAGQQMVDGDNVGLPQLVDIAFRHRGRHAVQQQF